jgi:hypothetical protein
MAITKLTCSHLGTPEASSCLDEKISLGGGPGAGGAGHVPDQRAGRHQVQVQNRYIACHRAWSWRCRART